MHLVKHISHKDVGAKLWLGTALDFLKSIRSQSVDVLISSPPYFVGKEYDRSCSLQDFETELSSITADVVRVLRPGGSVCWQIGNHVHAGRIMPLDAVMISILKSERELQLRNRIVWTFGHGTHSSRRFSGRHESVLWYTKGDHYYFELDAVRVPQKYPGKRHYKGPKKGLWSGNPLGKNPGDVWDIPNVKARHVEKTDHPCQFPTALINRLVLALSPEGGSVVDPYMGSATTGVSALMLGRNFEGSDNEPRYLAIAADRITALVGGERRVRDDKPARQPKITESVSKLPEHFRLARGA
jgi:adenine-specific DNA-methyltransferase